MTIQLLVASHFVARDYVCVFDWKQQSASRRTNNAEDGPFLRIDLCTRSKLMLFYYIYNLRVPKRPSQNPISFVYGHQVVQVKAMLQANMVFFEVPQVMHFVNPPRELSGPILRKSFRSW